MRESTRDAIFISHANPEDNVFTVWLGARLTAAGTVRTELKLKWQHPERGCWAVGIG